MLESFSKRSVRYNSIYKLEWLFPPINWYTQYYISCIILCTLAYKNKNNTLMERHIIFRTPPVPGKFWKWLHETGALPEFAAKRENIIFWRGRIGVFVTTFGVYLSTYQLYTIRLSVCLSVCVCIISFVTLFRRHID